ncbi:Sulfotransferase [Mactra antiquata]
MAFTKIPDLGGATMTMIDVDDPTFIHPRFHNDGPATKEIFQKVPDFQFRDDDVMLCTFAKTGTHWMYELISMAQYKSADRIKPSKVQTMLEAQTAEDIDKVPSPRVVNAHYCYRYLPVKGLREKQIKTVLCVRNPKDTAVSYYNHMCGIKFYEYNGKWEDWLPVYLDGKLEYGKYTSWLKEWDVAIRDGIGFPLHVIYYEDLKANCAAEFKKLLKFLDIELSDELQTQIIENCGFDQMAPTKYPPPIKQLFFKDEFNIFRKGETGDWQNWFTVAQNEMFDQKWSSEMKDHNVFDFKYTLPAKM